jgi:hypothetical protein
MNEIVNYLGGIQQAPALPYKRVRIPLNRDHDDREDLNYNTHYPIYNNIQGVIEDFGRPEPEPVGNAYPILDDNYEPAVHEDKERIPLNIDVDVRDDILIPREQRLWKDLTGPKVERPVQETVNPEDAIVNQLQRILLNTEHDDRPDELIPKNTRNRTN